MVFGMWRRSDAIQQNILRQYYSEVDMPRVHPHYNLYTHVRLAELGIFADPEDLARNRFEELVIPLTEIHTPALDLITWGFMEDDELRHEWLARDLGSMWDHLNEPSIASLYALPHSHDWLLAHSQDRLDLSPHSSSEDMMEALRRLWVEVASVRRSYTELLEMT